MRIAKIALASVLAVLGLATVQTAEAAYTAYLYQDGANVVATGSGSLDLTDLTCQGPAYVEVNVLANSGYLTLDVLASQSSFGPVSGPSSFGPGNGSPVGVPATTGSGSPVGVQGLDDLLSGGTGAVLLVPMNYVSGSDLGTSDAVFDNTTLAALGVIDGVYTWTWGNAPDADSFTLNIGTAPPVAGIPEPGSLALLAAGLAGIVVRRRRRSTVTWRR